MSAAALSDLMLEAALVVYAGAVLAYLAEILLAPSAQAPAESVGPGGGDSRRSGDRPSRPPSSPLRGAGPHAASEPAGSRWRCLASARSSTSRRWSPAGSPPDGRPWGNMFEFATVGALVAVGAFLVLQRRYDVHYLGVWVSALVLGVVGYAVTVLYTEAGPLLPALRSTWLVIHVLAAILATGLFTLGALVSLLYLIADRRTGGGGRFGAYVARLPEPPALDRLAFRLHAVAFPIWTFAVMAGAIWAQYAWGRYWGWDPKETWAFVSWVVYAAYLHARVTAGWKGRSAAAVALVGYATMLFNFIGVNIFLTGFHSYAGL